MQYNKRNTIIAGVLTISLLAARDTLIKSVVAICLVLVIANQFIQRRYNCFKMHLIASDAVNESLVLEGYVSGRNALFMVDTGYAGPPVLSASYLSIQDSCEANVRERFTNIMQTLERGVSVDEQNQAIDDFISRSGCMAYTSGCTMRLMGIGATQEQQADMLMCDMLELRTVSGQYGKPKRMTSAAHADVFVTNPLSSSIHIITCDFLVHSSPALLEISAGKLHLNMPVHEELFYKTRMTMHEVILSGGSYVVVIDIGDEKFRCTVDTGSPGPICLSASAVARLKKCKQGRERHVIRQSGVNGEEVCSEIVTATIKFCSNTFENVPIFANDTNTDQVDGYIGLGVLRAFDILITSNGIGFCTNGYKMLSAEEFKSSASVGACPGVSLSCDA